MIFYPMRSSKAFCLWGHLDLFSTAVQWVPGLLWQLPLQNGKFTRI